MFSTLTDPVDPAMVRGFTERLFAGPPPADFLDTQVAETLKVPARVIRSTWAGIREFDISDQLRLIDVPTLIVWGDHDDLPVASRETQENLVHAIPDAELVVYAGVGHSTLGAACPLRGRSGILRAPRGYAIRGKLSIWRGPVREH